MIEHKHLMACGFAACLALAGVGANAQQLLVNGDFQTGDLTGWTFTPNATAEASIAATVAPFAGSSAARVNTGSNLSGTEGGGTLSQTIQLVGGQQYTASAGLVAIAVVNGSPNADGGTITVAIGGSQIGVLDVGQMGANEQQVASFSLPAFVVPATGPADFTITFSRPFPNFSVTPALYHYVDNLSVVAVPEPATCCLAAFAVAGVVAIARRQRAITC